MTNALHQSLRQQKLTKTAASDGIGFLVEWIEINEPLGLYERALEIAGELGLGATYDAKARIENRFYDQEPFQVDVLDTTGAGDVFQGVFLVGLLSQWEPARILKQASAAAAMKCRHLGGQNGIPTMKELQNFL